MRRVWQDHRELELSLGASISVHCQSGWDAERQSTPSVLETQFAKSDYRYAAQKNPPGREPAGLIAIVLRRTALLRPSGYSPNSATSKIQIEPLAAKPIHAK